MELADGGDAQAVAAGTEVFFIGHDQADFAFIIRMTKDLRRAIAALADLVDPAAFQQFVAQNHAGDMMATEQLATLPGLHQLNKTQLNAARFDPRQESVQLMVVHITHQHGIDFDLVETGGERGIDAVHHLLELILAGNGVELTGVQAIDADVDRRQPRIAPVRHVTRHAVTVGGHRDLADTFVFTHGGNDVREITAQGGLSPGKTHFFRAKFRERARDAAYFIHGEKAIIGDAARLVAIGQAVGATEVTHVGNRQT